MVDNVPEVLTQGKLAEAMQALALQQDPDERIIDEAFILDDNKTIVSAKDVLRSAIRHSMRCFDSSRIIPDEGSSSLIDMMKTVWGTSQSDMEINEQLHGDSSFTLAGANVISPPYPPEILSAFLEVDSTHFRCCRTKVTDAVGRAYTLEPTTDDKNAPFDPNNQTKAQEKKIAEETQSIQNFILDANRILGFEGVLDRVWMDYEAVGWGAIEVIRSRDMKVRHFAHIPAPRVRVLRGWRGFVEIMGSAKFQYYQNFGEKVLSKNRVDPITNRAEPYDPLLDGPLDPNRLDWNLVNRETGQPTNSLTKAANELIWIPHHHSNTIYYGFSDIVPALGDLLSNVNIRDYVLQFFENNTVPRYAIIVEGAKISDPVKKLITEYFGTHVKGKPHKTLIIPIPAIRGEVKVRFERLDADTREADYQSTRKNQNQHIMTAHGVSPAIIGVADAAELGSGKGLAQAEIYKDRIISPSQRRADSAINKLFRYGLGITVVDFKHIPLDVRDAKQEQNVFTGYLDAGVLTINEVRLKAKLGGPLDGGNRAFIVTSKGIVFVDELANMDGAGIQAAEEAEAKREAFQNNNGQNNKGDEGKELFGNRVDPSKIIKS